MENTLNASTLPFWPAGRRRLVLRFSAGDDAADTCSANGLDPDNNNQVVFTASLLTTQQAAFIQAVLEARAGTLLAASNQNGDLPGSFTVVIPDPGPGPGPGPNCYVVPA